MASNVGVGHSWSNPSVRAFAADADPLQAAHLIASRLYDEAHRLGVAGPPVDVLRLAEGLGVALQPRDDLIDAQIRAVEGDALVIEYNPNRPRGRLRFSIAHEIAHAQFADVGHQPRHRTAAGSVADSDSDDWELELLCDVIAADLLLPGHAVDGIVSVDPDIDFLMDVRRRWDVSTEALLRRVVAATPRPLMMIAGSRPGDSRGDTIRVDYVERSPAAADLLPELGHRDLIAGLEPALACTAVGQTSRGITGIGGQDYHVQAVGTPPYPGRRWPRVLALIEPPEARAPIANLNYITSDILQWEGDSSVLLAHVVSDSTRGWSRFGVAGALGKAFPDIAGAYRAWTLSNPEHLQLGSVHHIERLHEGRRVGVASLVAQEGYGPGKSVRLQYDALGRALDEVAALAREYDSVVHVPRLGAGQAGGRWDRIEALLAEKLANRGIRVVVHTLPPASDGGRL